MIDGVAIKASESNNGTSIIDAHIETVTQQPHWD